MCIRYHFTLLSATLLCSLFLQLAPKKNLVAQKKEIRSLLDTFEKNKYDDYSRSKQVLDSVLSYELVSNNDSLKASIFLDYAGFNISWNKIKETKKYLHFSLNYFSRASDTLHHISTLIMLNDYNYLTENSRQRLHFLNEALHLAKALDDKKQLHEVYFATGGYYYDIRNYKEALRYYQLSFDYCDTPLDCDATRTNIAFCLIKTGEPSKALNIYFEQLEILKKENADHKDKEKNYSLGLLNNHIAFLLKENELFPESIEYYERALDLYQNSSRPFYVAAAHEGLGYVYLALDELGKAEKAFTTAFDIWREEQPSLIPDAFLNLAAVKLKQKKIDSTRYYLNKALPLFVRSENVNGKANTSLLFSKCFLEEGNIQEALKENQIALEIFKSLDATDQIAQSLELQRDIYRSQGLDKKELFYQRKLDSIKALSFTTRDVNELSKGILLDSLRSKEREVEERASLAKTETNLYFWMFLLGVPIVLLFIYRFNKKYSLSTKGSITTSSSSFTLSSSESLQIKETLLELFSSERPYLDTAISIIILSKMIDTSPRKLSYVLNHALHTTFYDFVNQYRIDHFLDELKKAPNHQYSLFGLAQNCGFKSKSSFYRAFKKYKGVSPSKYLENS